MKNDDIKFDLEEDILLQIAMITYDRHNSTIADIYDHLGDIYSYSDLEDAKIHSLKDENHLLELAVIQLQEEIIELKKLNKQ